MNRQIINIFLLLVIMAFPAAAQEKVKFPLRIGDKMPELVFHTMVNYPGGKAKLSDFVGKPVILDFWHVQCTSCILGMPKLQELQRKFGDQIQIIGFGLNNLSDYKKLKKNSPILKDITSLPLALQADTPLFKKMVEAYPTHVWIDKNGIIRAVTNTVNATEEHIRDFIAGKPLSFIMQKPQEQPNALYPLDTSILVQGSGKNLKLLQYHSLFSKRIDFNNGDGDAYYFHVGPKKPGIKRINITFRALIYQGWYSDVRKDCKIILETDDLKKKFIFPKDEDYDQWLQDNTYCYELSLTDGKKYSTETILEYLRQDIQRFFGIKVESKPRQTACLILYRLDNRDRIRTKGILQDKEYKSGMTYGEEWKNVPMKLIVSNIEGGLSWQDEPVKVIDETSYTQNVDIKFDHKLDDINLVRSSLMKYGLGLREEQRMVDCLVISKAD